jgi:hypothetical protein
MFLDVKVTFILLAYLTNCSNTSKAEVHLNNTETFSLYLTKHGRVR